MLLGVIDRAGAERVVRELVDVHEPGAGDDVLDADAAEDRASARATISISRGVRAAKSAWPPSDAPG